MPEPGNSDVELKLYAQTLGFDVVRVAAAVSPPGYHPLLEWMSRGYDADMEWIARRKDAYAHPNGVLPGTRSVIVVAMNYHNQPPDSGGLRVARYAWGTEDYHTTIRRQLKKLTSWLRERQPQHRTRAVVDTAPLLERDFARLAGIGWFGKNTMLISRDIGSWFFLGAVLTTAELPRDDPFEQDFCGTCTRCMDACPTDAFPEPYVLDSNRCISYLTIERRDKSIATQLREDMQGWVYGCDVCQEVCPWNRFAPPDSRPEFHPREDLRSLNLNETLLLTDATFLDQFRGTPMERTGRAAIVRNAAIAAANLKITESSPVLQQLLSDESEMVRDAAAWALARMAPDSDD